MDADLAGSLDIEVPSDLIARLQLNQELVEENEISQASNVAFFQPVKRYAIAASVAVALFVAGFMASNQFGVNQQIGKDYESLLSAVVEHMNEQPVTPVWSTKRANESVNALLASYDGKMKLKYLSNLQFSRICPMGNYKGLHANLETANGQVTFAYIKGDSVGDLLDAGYEGYMTRIKPVRGGNLIIMSRTTKALQEADSQLKDAMYWDI
jgi:hypothetical protein